MATCRGIDVSAYQGTQNWTALKADGLVFAFAKASEGQKGRDARFATHIKGIKAAGLVPGAYHFAWPNQDPKAEAANYIAAVKPYAGKGFTHWLDLERYSDGRNYRGKSAAQIKSWVQTWLSQVQSAFPGQRIGVYTSADDLKSGYVPAGTPLWYPAYPWGAAPYSKAEAASKPKPAGWSPMIWQFTSQPMDRSICYMSAADLRAWAGGTATKPTPAPSKPQYEPFPGASWFKEGRKSPIVAAMHDRLVAVGCDHYKSSRNKDVIGSGDKASYEAWQRKLGYSGTDAKWPPGPTSWAKLHVPNV
ncbi:GH25 family lysozyme [Streptomyces lydicus]|uniref:GH25 family lysozyme n=1 Tax=Streptomyces lydicus TaxID=47763 RepID=UPI00378A9963